MRWAKLWLFEILHVKVLLDVACQKLLKPVNVSRSCAKKNKSGLVFLGGNDVLSTYLLTVWCSCSVRRNRRAWTVLLGRQLLALVPSCWPSLPHRQRTSHPTYRTRQHSSVWRVWLFTRCRHHCQPIATLLLIVNKMHQWKNFENPLALDEDMDLKIVGFLFWLQ